MKRIFRTVLFLVLISACSSDNEGEATPIQEGADDVQEEPTAVSFERGPMLVYWADNIIIPSYEAFTEDMKVLSASFETFKSSPDATNLVTLRTSWIAAYKSWQNVAMFEIGPAESADFRFSMNTYPTDTEKIEDHITSGTYDLSLSSNRVAKGFPALDYLINGLGENDEVIIGKYSSKDQEALLSYTEAVLDDMNTLTEQVVTGWKDDYRDTFVANDGASATASVDRFVNDFIFYYEKFLRAGKMGIPLGVFSGSPLPDRLEGYYQTDISDELFLTGLDAVQNFFNGKGFGLATSGASLASYLDALNTVKEGVDLKTIINDQFDKARDMVVSLDGFREEIEDNTPPTDMLMAYDEVQRIVPLLKVDMVSAMSISIDFVDADGD